MTQLTEERFEEILSKRLAHLAAKEDLKPLATRADVREAVEELARMVSGGFEDVQHRLDVQSLIQAHELKFKKLEEALHITL